MRKRERTRARARKIINFCLRKYGSTHSNNKMAKSLVNHNHSFRSRSRARVGVRSRLLDRAISL